MNSLKIKAMCISFALAMSIPFAAYAESANKIPDSAGPYFSVGMGGSLRGVWLESYGNKDYPSAPKLSVREMEKEAVEIVNQVSALGYDSIFYNVSPEAAAVYKTNYLPSSRFLVGNQGELSFGGDPLKILTDAAEKKEIDVCAVVTPLYLGSMATSQGKTNSAGQSANWTITLGGRLYFNPASKDVQELIASISGELATRYRLAGIAIDFSGYNGFLKDESYYNNLIDILKGCSQSIKNQRPDVKLGTILDGSLSQDTTGRTFISRLTQENDTDFALPKMEVSVAGENLYEQSLRIWKKLSDGTNLQVFTLNLASRLLAPSSTATFFGDPQEITYQQYANTLLNVNGLVVSSLRDLKINVYPLAQDLAAAKNMDSSLVHSLNFPLPKGFAITNPPSSTSTSQASAYITGICSPQKPLTVNGALVEDVADWGGFGVLVNLNYGSNQFEFEQDEVKKTVSIIRKNKAGAKKQEPISAIEGESAYPRYDEIVAFSEDLILQCVGPSGGKITAQLEGKSYPLKQVDSKVPDGLPTKFTAKVDKPVLGLSDATNIGTVTYMLVYGGKTTIQTADGSITLLGEHQRAAIKVADEFASVYEDASSNVVTNILTKGTCDYVGANVAATTGDYFKLQSGGYIHKSAAQSISSPAEIMKVDRDIKNVVVQSISDGEYITFANGGGLPCSLSYNEEERSLSITLYNTLNIQQNLKHLKSELFSNIEVKKEDNSATVVFTLKDDSQLYGYHVVFNEGNMILYCKTNFLETADSTQADKPLAGLNVVIDPGQGGSAENNQGMAGAVGVNDGELNLAVSVAVANRLQAIGASVSLTRTDDSPVADIDRVMQGRFQDADLFLSIHQSSTPSQLDGSTESGVSVSYNLPFTEPFAAKLSSSLSAGLGRKNNGLNAENSYIKKVTMSPAVQINLGYITNPYEYPALCDSLNLYRTSCIISRAVVELVENK